MQQQPQHNNANNNNNNGQQQGQQQQQGQGPQMNVNVNQQLQGMNHLNNLQNMMQNMGISPMNQINVNQMLNQLPAITPTSKMNGFSFNNPGQIAPAYLPPLATTPRFAVTPRGTTPRFNAMNNVMNSAPIQIPTSLLKNTSSGSSDKKEIRMEKLKESKSSGSMK